MQTRFAPCNTISYACKHVLHRCNNSFGGQNGLLHRCNNSFGGQNGLLHRCSKRFGGRNDRYNVAVNDSEVWMAITSLQQLIRRSIWPLHRCSNWFGGAIWPLHRCNNWFGGQYGRYIAATAHSVGRTGFYIAATRHNSYVTYEYVSGSIKFVSVPTILPSNAPTSLTFLQSCRQKRHER